jgi:AcrR family transcriptional regulator
MSRHGETRLLLVEHAHALLTEEGLEGVTIRGVARRAGLSHGAPLRHFPSLAALLSAVAANGFDDLLGRLKAAAASVQTSGLDPRGELLALSRCYVTFAREEPALFELMFRHDLLDNTGENLRSHSLPVFGVVVEAVARAGAGDPRALTTDLWASIHGVAVLASRRSLEVMSEEHPDELLARQVRAHLPG